MSNAYELFPNVFVHFRVVNGKVMLMADDVARAVGYRQTGRSGDINALHSDTGIGLTAPKSFLFFEGKQRLFWSKPAFTDFCRRAQEGKFRDNVRLLSKILGLYDKLKTADISVVEHGKKVALRAYIVDGEMHIKFQGEDKTRTTKSFKTEADSYSVEIKKKNFGKYVFNKQDVKVY